MAGELGGVGGRSKGFIKEPSSLNSKATLDSEQANLRAPLATSSVDVNPSSTSVIAHRASASDILDVKDSPLRLIEDAQILAEKIAGAITKAGSQSVFTHNLNESKVRALLQ